MIGNINHIVFIEGANAAWMLGNWQTLEEFLEVRKKKDNNDDEVEDKG